ncbi:YjdJ family protein [Oceanobacillus luteolus]|uniref:YjdJ family protein n=1 Tax=Oceanobacillus luteolus TaxID=1274358 RepID=A0ABW4HRS2_9BACI
MKYIIQYLSALILFIFSTFAAWYEGSAIRENPWEWKYTAFFSNINNAWIIDGSDISQLDHFIYAAKFYPIFPILMVLSFSYLVILSGYLLFKYDTKKLNIFLSSFGLIQILLGIMVSDSPTIGGKTFTVTFLMIGMFSSALSFLRMKKLYKEAL